MKIIIIQLYEYIKYSLKQKPLFYFIFYVDISDSQVVSEKNLVRLPVSCATCNYVLNTMSDAQSHLSMNPNCRTSQFKCLLCPKLFIWPATLIKHFREQHQGPGGTARVTQRLWFFCDICKKPLLSKHALCLHRSKFHGFSSHSLGSDSPGNLMLSISSLRFKYLCKLYLILLLSESSSGHCGCQVRSSSINIYSNTNVISV